jgi:transposase InsO family protein
MVHIEPTTNEVSAVETANMFVKAVYRLHGLPAEVITDRGTQFTGTFWESLTERLGFKSKKSTAYHPQTDGQTERANRVVIETLRNYCTGAGKDWDEHLPLVEFAINNSVSSATGMSPFYMNYGFHPNIPATINHEVRKHNPTAQGFAEALHERVTRAKACMQAAQARMKIQYDKGHRPVTFEVDDLVLLSTKNLKVSTSLKAGTSLYWTL